MKVSFQEHNRQQQPLSVRIKTPQFQKKLKEESFRVLTTILFTFIYGIGMSWFIEYCKIRLYSGGMPGLAQIIVDILKLSKLTLTDKSIGLIMGGLIMLFNVPVFILGWFGVSKKFTLYSLLSVVIQSTVLAFIKFDFFKELDPIMHCVIGGTLMGIGVGGTLKFGGSTGGFDIVGQFVAHRTGKTVAFISTMLNIAITVIGSIILGFQSYTGVLTAIDLHQKRPAYVIASKVMAYTVLRLMITMLVTDKIHTSYKYLEVNIISEFPIELTEQIILGIGRGVTLLDVRGGYGYSERQMIYLVIYAHEKHALERIINEVDSHAFTVYKEVAMIRGNFKKKYIS